MSVERPSDLDWCLTVVAGGAHLASSGVVLREMVDHLHLMACGVSRRRVVWLSVHGRSAHTRARVAWDRRSDEAVSSLVSVLGAKISWAHLAMGKWLGSDLDWCLAVVTDDAHLASCGVALGKVVDHVHLMACGVHGRCVRHTHRRTTHVRRWSTHVGRWSVHVSLRHGLARRRSLVVLDLHLVVLRRWHHWLDFNLRRRSTLVHDGGCSDGLGLLSALSAAHAPYDRDAAAEDKDHTHNESGHGATSCGVLRILVVSVSSIIEVVAIAIVICLLILCRVVSWGIVIVDMIVAGEGLVCLGICSVVVVVGVDLRSLDSRVGVGVRGFGNVRRGLAVAGCGGSAVAGGCLVTTGRVPRGGTVAGGGAVPGRCLVARRVAGSGAVARGGAISSGGCLVATGVSRAVRGGRLV